MKLSHGSVLLFLLAACSTAENPASNEVSVIRFSEIFDPESHIVDRVEIVAPERSEWVAADAQTPWTWRAVAGLADARIDGEALAFETETETSVLELVAPGALGDGDQLRALEVRMAVSAGKEFHITALGDEGPPADAFAGGETDLAVSSPLRPGEEATTYRIDLTRTFTFGAFARREPTRIVLRPSDEAGAQARIESVRLIFRREHFASVPSGLGWHGLGEVWRETLTSRPGETLRIALTVPKQRPVLDLAVGTPVDLPITFTATLAGPEESPLIRRTVTTSERWESEQVDLSAVAGRDVELLLRIQADDPGAVGLWGSGVVASRLPVDAESSKPQGAIVIIADTLRRDHLDAWGYERQTAPTLTRLGEEGVRFADTITQAVWTKVSVPSILTGLYPDTHGIVDIPDRLPASATTLAEAFRSAGYATMATSSWSFTGQMTNLHQGVDVLWEGGSVDLPDESRTKTARFFFDRALEFIEAHRHRRFLVVLHLGDPHSPYEPLGRYADMWSEPGSKERHDKLRDEVVPEIESPFFQRMKLPQQTDIERQGMDLEWWRDHEIDWYDGSIRGLDAEIQRLIDRLDHLDLRQKTLVAFTSDHGEEFFEHGNNWHGTNLYGHQTDVPFILWGPGFLPGGLVVEPTVQTIDLYPTLLELAGIEAPEMTQGRSLLPLVEALAAGEAPAGRGFRPAPAFVRHVTEEAPGMPDSMIGTSRAVVTPEWRLVHHVEGHEGLPEWELYARQQDSLSLVNVADEHPEVVEQLAAQLGGWHQSVAEQQLPAEDTEAMSAEDLERLRSLGYL